MIKAIFWCFEMLLKYSLIVTMLCASFCLNGITLPIFFICLLFCKRFNLRKPHVGAYGLMIYPKWSHTPDGSMFSDLNSCYKKEQRKIKKHRPYSFEEMWFYDDLFGD